MTNSKQELKTGDKVKIKPISCCKQFTNYLDIHERMENMFGDGKVYIVKDFNYLTSTVRLKKEKNNEHVKWWWDRDWLEKVEEPKVDNGTGYTMADWYETTEDLNKYIKSYYAGWISDYFVENQRLKNNKLINKTMNVIKNTFKSKTRKALEYFDIVDGNDNLTSNGRIEFLDFLWEKDKENKKEFEKLIVKQYEEENR